MDKATSSPYYVAIFFFIRCVLPLVIMLGASYLLRKFGVISDPSTKLKTRNSETDEIEKTGGGASHVQS